MNSIHSSSSALQFIKYNDLLKYRLLLKQRMETEILHARAAAMENEKLCRAVVMESLCSVSSGEKAEVVNCGFR